jgi:hypothetical protein
MKKDNLLGILILVLIAIVFIQRCDKPVEVIDPQIVRDTVWVKHDSIIYSKPKVIKTIEVEIKDSLIYLPDTNYQVLLSQYKDVVNQLLVKNITLDSIRIDTNGYVKIYDTLQKNLIIGRSSEVFISYPIIKETITLQQKPKNQLYIGGGVSGSQNALINQIRAGVLLKNKKDQIYGASVGLGLGGTPIYGIDSYWKIKLK